MSYEALISEFVFNSSAGVRRVSSRSVTQSQRSVSLFGDSRCANYRGNMMQKPEDVSRRNKQAGDLFNYFGSCGTKDDIKAVKS